MVKSTQSFYRVFVNSPNFHFPYQIRDMKREECECDLQFAGFVVIACPLKSDSKAAIKQIQESSHHVSIGAAQTATS